MRLFNILKDIIKKTLKVNDASIKETLTPTPVTLPSGVSGEMWYYKKGTRVILQGKLYLTANTWTTVLSLPSGYRPKADLYTVVNTTGVSASGFLIVGALGAVQTYTTNGYSRFYFEFDAFN